MMTLKFVFLVIGMVAVNLGYNNAYSIEERTKIYASMLPHVMECGKEYSISEDDLKVSNDAGKFDSINPCFMGCVFKKIDVLNDEGIFIADKAIDLAQSFLIKEDDKKKAAAIIKACATVNDESVSEGDKSCKRAKLLFDCLLPFRVQFSKDL